MLKGLKFWHVLKDCFVIFEEILELLSTVDPSIEEIVKYIKK